MRNVRNWSSLHILVKIPEAKSNPLKSGHRTWSQRTFWLFSCASQWERESDSKFRKSEKSKKRETNQLLDASTSLKIIGGAVVGLLIALPPFINDAKMRNFFSSSKGTADTIVALGKAWPVDNIRLNRIIISLSNGNENEKARELSEYATLKFPMDFNGWWTLDQLTREGVPVKEAIRIKLHEIDPHNPAYFKKWKFQ